jgi:tripartite-type tricarboxylate transporter receptor subunit TctC
MLRASVVFIAVVVAVPALAQSWPDRPVRLVIGNAPASTPDIVARTYASGMERLLGQPMIVENRPGADGTIAANLVARADPDGYALLVGSQQVFAISPHTRKELPFDTARDFRTIGVLIDETLGNSIVVSDTLPITKLADLVAYAKANPGKLTYSTSVANQSLFMAWFKRRAGVEMREVRYKDPSMAIQDVIAGRVSVTANSQFSVVPGIQSGKLRLLATAASERFKDWPDVPTIVEVYPDYNMSGFFVLMGPARLPNDIVSRLNRDTDAVVKSAEFRDMSRKITWFNSKGALTPEAAAALIRGQSDVYRELVRDLGIKPQ